MGIPGLTTYIRNRSDRYMQYYELYNTILVIDGNSLASQLYTSSGSRCCFGGDYDTFGKAVEEFFAELSKCNIESIVLFDGGIEDKKIQTMISRIKERIRLIGSFTPADENGFTKVFPTLIKEAFKEKLPKMNVKFAQTTLEADSDIAAVAKALKCPILSLDSDFYIYDIPYIPYNDLKSGVTLRPDGKGYMKTCMIYQVERLLESTPGLDKSVLPLLAALLGNDYVNQRIFTRFFQNLKLPKTSRRIYNEQQRRIEAIFQWLKHHNLNTAITSVLAKLPQKDHLKVLKSIELVVNSYRILSPQILLTLGYSKNEVEAFANEIKQHPYRYRESFNTQLCNDIIDDETLKTLDSLPEWFLKEFNEGHFPAFFIDFLLRQLNIMSVQIEDIKYPATSLISLPILGVMYRFVTAGIVVPYKPLNYIVRNKHGSCETKTLESSSTILGLNYPSLHKLRELPENIMRKSMNVTIGIEDTMKIEEIIDEWQLYIGTLIFWLKEDVQPKRNYVHVYSLLFAMLFNIIDKKIGFYRRKELFLPKYETKMNEIKNQKRQSKVIKDVDCSSCSMAEAIDQVTEDDCLMAVLYFIKQFNMNNELSMNDKKFNITIVHVFGLFQSCLKNVLYLNALLGYPYQTPKITELFNGTLLYNLYIKFKDRNDLDMYINTILQDSPSLLKIFRILLQKVRHICQVIDINIDAVVMKRQNRRKKNNKWKDAIDTMNPSDEVQECEEIGCQSTDFGDNKFALLSII